MKTELWNNPSRATLVVRSLSVRVSRPPETARASAPACGLLHVAADREVRALAAVLVARLQPAQDLHFREIFTLYMAT